MESKYRARKATYNGEVFDSKAEARRYAVLLAKQEQGILSALQRQVKHDLIPAQYEYIPTGETYKTGRSKGLEKVKRVCVEKAVTYTSDFEYDENGVHVVEDVKGMKTKEYIIKRKLMLYLHGIKIREIKNP